MELRRENALVVFTVAEIRAYRENDLAQLVKVYKSAFAERPWNEYMKCSSCGVNYGKRELQMPRRSCKKCDNLLVLREFWSFQEIEEDLESGRSQRNPIVLVADKGKELAGFTWGYQLPLEKFPFLAGKVPKETNYMDEIAVTGSKREKGIGTALGLSYLELAQKQRMLEVVLRTDERNEASMGLFKKLGFMSIPDAESARGNIYDPNYSDRIYLRRRLGK